MQSVVYVEIDIPVCELVYGEAPCEAAIGVTGPAKCFNSMRTCQDRLNFLKGSLTLRFTEGDARDDPNDAIPSLMSVEVTPAIIDPGVSMGQRESVTVSFRDHPHSDIGLDPYVEERAYDSFAQGTFWGRLRGRYAGLKGRALRVIRGERGQAIESMRTWHYIIETTSGPRQDRFTVTGKDFLKLADGDRSQAPGISVGQLAADIGEGASSVTLLPAGIGEDYPLSGMASIGGQEIVSYSRTGDTFSISRAQSNTVAVPHSGGDIFQIVLEYIAESPENIIYDLLTNYANIDPLLIPLADWQADVGGSINRVYSAEIAKPTAVHELVNELIEQVGLILWADPELKQIRLVPLRPIGAAAEVIDESRMLRKSYSSTEQPKKRISQAWTYFNLINPLEAMDDTTNFKSAVATIDPDASEDEFEDQPAIRKVYSRWIDGGNRLAAQGVNQRLLARFSYPPRKFVWDQFVADSLPERGRGFRVAHWSLQNPDGSRQEVPVQIISMETRHDRVRITAEELQFISGITDGRTIIIDFDGFNINLRQIHDQFFIAPSMYDEVTFVIESGSTIGGLIPGVPAVTVGDWPEGVIINLIINGAIRGQGGDGGGFRSEQVETGDIEAPFVDVLVPEDGIDGSPGIFTRVPIRITNNGVVAGGGGGGAAEIFFGGSFVEGGWDVYIGGGGGAGYIPGPGGVAIGGAAGVSGNPGTMTAGGAGANWWALAAGTGPAGGNPGANGAARNPGGEWGGSEFGVGGLAVDGDELIDWQPEGTILGARVDSSGP